MSVITSSTPTFYRCNESVAYNGVSAVVGYEKPDTWYDRIVRYSFTAPAEGATSISISFGNVSFASGTSQILYVKITEDATSYPLCGTQNNGTVSFVGSSAVGTATYTFSPNTVYYIWVYPSSHSKTGWWYWNTSACSVTTSGSTAAVTPSVSPLSIALGDSLIITAKPPVNGYKCKLSCGIKNSPVYSTTFTYTSPSVTVETNTDAFIDAFINSTSGSSVELEATCDTYTGGGVFVGTKTTVVMISLPNSGSTIYNNYFKPIVSLEAESHPETNTIDDIVSTIRDWEQDNVYISGYSTLKLTPSFSSNSNASLSDYSLVCNGRQLGSGKQLKEKYMHTLYANSAVEELVASLYVTDSRGCKGAVSTSPYTVYAYNKPAFRISTKGRCNSDYDGVVEGNKTYIPTANGDKAYIKLDAVTFSSVSGKNACTAEVLYMGNSIGSFNVSSSKTEYEFIAQIEDGFNLENQYELTVKLTDSLKSVASSTVVIPKRSVGLHLMKGGLGVAVGKYADEPGIFDIGFSARFCGGVTPVRIEKLSESDFCTDTNIYIGNDESCNGDFILKVFSMNSDSSKCVQQIIHYDSDGIYTQATRYLDGNNGWTAWDYLPDRIVEYGTSGIWTWRKWSSGIAECWGIYNGTGINASKNNYMGFYYSDVIRIDLPFTFSDTPVVTVSGGGYNNMTLARTGPSTSSQAGIWVVSHDSTATNVEIYADINVKGKWK